MIEAGQWSVGRMTDALSISLSAPAAVALAIVLVFFLALWGLIGYGLWRATQQRSGDRRRANRRVDPDKKV